MRVPRKKKKQISKIPKGVYCYDDNGICPHLNFSRKSYKTCAFLKYFEYEPGLDDSCKICNLKNINNEI